MTPSHMETSYDTLGRPGNAVLGKRFWIDPRRTRHINVESPAEAERIFTALKENGRVTMPFGETFWAVRFGMLVDRFGIPWMVNCEKAAQKAA